MFSFGPCHDVPHRGEQGVAINGALAQRTRGARGGRAGESFLLQRGAR